MIDRVISSYTPTVRALSHARRASSPGSGDLAGAERTLGHGLAVAMPHTPGQRDLPGVHDEVADLEHCLPGQLNVLEGPQATRDKVLQALPAARWAHFACHAYSDPEDPSASQLLLADQPLTVADIANLRLDGARLAYLSACSTGRPGFRLSDEAIHLASAFQLAGYRQVVAHTLANLATSTPRTSPPVSTPPSQPPQRCRPRGTQRHPSVPQPLAQHPISVGISHPHRRVTGSPPAFMGVKKPQICVGVSRWYCTGEPSLRLPTGASVSSGPAARARTRYWPTAISC